MTIARRRRRIRLRNTVGPWVAAIGLAIGIAGLLASGGRFL